VKPNLLPPPPPRSDRPYPNPEPIQPGADAAAPGGRAQVYALPGLEALLERPVAAVLGFALPLPADPHGLGLLPRLVSLSPDGQLALARPPPARSGRRSAVRPQGSRPGPAPSAPTCTTGVAHACRPGQESQAALAGRAGRRAPRSNAAGRAPPAGAERRRRRAGGPQRGAGAHWPGALAAAADAPGRALRLGPGRRRARRCWRAARAARGRAAAGAAALVRRAPPAARRRAAHAKVCAYLKTQATPPPSTPPSCAQRSLRGMRAGQPGRRRPRARRRAQQGRARARVRLWRLHDAGAEGGHARRGRHQQGAAQPEPGARPRRPAPAPGFQELGAPACAAGRPQRGTARGPSGAPACRAWTGSARTCWRRATHSRPAAARGGRCPCLYCSRARARPRRPTRPPARRRRRRRCRPRRRRGAPRTAAAGRPQAEPLADALRAGAEWDTYITPPRSRPA
jgi:hypothetical protein